ncbi:hypothetical protein MW290_28105 [Aquincola tertiaricarbonis]|uniref:Uncharacterized protein n=1 Tax=Aquincola tertiaricarbonis TaxID=391953 RepID=A0ABY4SBI5_AQUTE|nr:hypothetical protein [Aquincola tertiaricarbonis]URI09431.1 hypothetical protein MW290_28105 [Aquincola tertiaricarbonis]
MKSIVRRLNPQPGASGWNPSQNQPAPAFDKPHKTENIVALEMAMQAAHSTEDESFSPFPVPRNFAYLLATALRRGGHEKCLDAVLIEILFEPIRSFIEWQLAEGELASNSCAALSDLLGGAPTLFNRRTNAPAYFLEPLRRATKDALEACSLPEGAMWELWRGSIVPFLIAPAIEAFTALGQPGRGWGSSLIAKVDRIYADYHSRRGDASTAICQASRESF